MNKAKLNRFLEIFIALAFVAVLVYVVSVTIRVTTGVSRTAGSPANQVRLQVLNGCGETGLASRVAGQLSGYRDDDLEIKVVDAGNFEIMEVPESFLISRVKNTSAAATLARKLGLDPMEIEYKPLENNSRHVTVTLVLGLDHGVVVLQKQQREN